MKYLFKQNTRLGSTLSPRFKKKIVKENKNTTIVTEAGSVIHFLQRGIFFNNLMETRKEVNFGKPNARKNNFQ